MERRSPLLPLLTLLLAALPPAQNRAGTNEDDAKTPKDPFTGGDAKAMTAAGVVAYGPFLLAPDVRTEDVEKVLGENRIRWLENAHFRIGCTLATAPPPTDPDARNLLQAELGRLKKRGAKFPDRASRLEPWLRVHLFAQRAEELYGEIAALVGHDDATGTHLGSQHKLPLLLFQRKSDLARYLDRFCNVKSEVGQRTSFPKVGLRGLALAAETDDVRDEAAVHAQFRFLLTQTLCDSLGGVPYWLSLGLAHVYERQVPSALSMAVPKADENVDAQTQNQWSQKMRRRAQRPELLIPFAELAGKIDFGYWAHVQAWSRVDFLLALDRAKFGRLLAGVRGSQATSRQVEQLELVFGLDPETFDARWRKWVLENDR
ncbi:MAG: hypothetical protein WAT39_21960 [Planctomycetota bacterium]